MSRRLVVSGGSRPRELVLVDTVTVGRDPACDVSEVNDPLLSRRHAVFTSARHDAGVRDLDSRNGILVNGTKKKESRLQHGDVVQIGHLQVRFVDEVGPFTDVPAPDDATVTLVADVAATQVLDAPTVANASAVTKKRPR